MCHYCFRRFRSVGCFRRRFRSDVTAGSWIRNTRRLCLRYRRWLYMSQAFSQRILKQFKVGISLNLPSSPFYSFYSLSYILCLSLYRSPYVSLPVSSNALILPVIVVHPFPLNVNCRCHCSSSVASISNLWLVRHCVHSWLTSYPRMRWLQSYPVLRAWHWSHSCPVHPSRHWTGTLGRWYKMSGPPVNLMGFTDNIQHLFSSFIKPVYWNNGHTKICVNYIY